MILDFNALLGGLKAAGEDTRLRILALLSGSELTVSDLMTILGQSQPRISRHLKLLHEAHVLERYREGAWVYYALVRSEPMAGFVAAVLSCVHRQDVVFARDAARLSAVRQERAVQAQAYFDSIAADWDRLRSLHVLESDVERAVLEVVGTAPIASYLDIGTGTGKMLTLLAQRAKSALGVDLSHDMLSMARAHLEKADLRSVQVRSGDAYALPFADASFDLVSIHQLLHFLDEPQRALREARRVLRPDGRLLLVDFAAHGLDFLREAQAHRRLGFADDTMRGWLTALGLEVAPVVQLAPSVAKEEDALTVSIWLAHLPTHL